jgi:hypothetical protein
MNHVDDERTKGREKGEEKWKRKRKRMGKEFVPFFALFSYFS